jgi:hypothetical protein
MRTNPAIHSCCWWALVFCAYGAHKRFEYWLARRNWNRAVRANFRQSGTKYSQAVSEDVGWGCGSGRNRWFRVENSKKRLSLCSAHSWEIVCARGSGTRGVVCSARRRQRNQPRTQTKVHSVSWFAASAHVTRFRSTRGGNLAQFWSVLRDVERTGYTCCQLVDYCLCLAFFACLLLALLVRAGAFTAAHAHYRPCSAVATRSGSAPDRAAQPATLFRSFVPRNYKCQNLSLMIVRNV